MSETSDDIAVRLSGGLGNQLFQAAAAIAVAARSGRDPVFDVSFFDKTRSGRRYALDALAVPFRTTRLFVGGPIAAARRKLREGLGLAPPARRWNGPVHRQTGFGFDPSFRSVSAPCLLLGDFQSPLYFEEAEARIRAVFDVSSRLSDAARPHLEAIAAGDAVSVHVRRGDYASDPGALHRHGLIGEDYYRGAVARIRERTGCGRFFVFSDAPAEARRLLGEDGFTYVEGTGPLDDFHLMSRCRHHVIANSTFSWWAARLGEGGTTVAPKNWFSPDWAERPDTADLFPPEWILS